MKQATAYTVGRNLLDPAGILAEGVFHADFERPEDAIANCGAGTLYKITVTVEEVPR